MTSKLQKLWDLTVQVSDISLEIDEMKKHISSTLHCCPNQMSDDIFENTPTTHLTNWIEQAREGYHIEDLEEFGECHYCLDAYQTIKKYKVLKLKRGYLRSRITKLVRGGNHD